MASLGLVPQHTAVSRRAHDDDQRSRLQTAPWKWKAQSGTVRVSENGALLVMGRSS